DQQRDLAARSEEQNEHGGAVERAHAALPGASHAQSPDHEAGAHDTAAYGSIGTPGSAGAHVPVAVTAAPVPAPVADHRMPLVLPAVLAVAWVLVLVARAFASECTPPSGSPEITRQGT